MSDETQDSGGVEADLLMPVGSEAETAVPEGQQEGEAAPTNKTLGFKERFSSDPDWAWEEFRKTQGSFHREQQKAKKLSALEPYVDAVGGPDGILSLLNRYSQLTANPRMSQVVDRFLATGDVTVQNADPYAPQMPEDDPLTAEVRQLRGEVQRIHSEQGTGRARAFVDRLFSEYPLNDEQKVRIAGAIDSTVRQWSTRADGVEVLRNLNYDTFKSLALKEMTPDDLADIGERLHLARQQTKNKAATDSPSRVATNGRAVAKQMSTVDAFREAFRQFGVDKDRPLL